MRDLGTQISPLRTCGRNHNLRTLIDTRSRIVQSIHGRPGLKMQVAFPVNSLQDMPEIVCDVMDIERRLILLSHDEQILGERQLPLSEDCIGCRQYFLRSTAGSVRNVAFAADREQ